MIYKSYESYKDSGVEWIGEIPEHWELRKLKYLVNERLMYGANESAELDDPSLPRYIRITDFGEDGKLRDDTFKSLHHDVAQKYLLDEGDILFARSGATVGKTFQFKDYMNDACFAGYLIKASPNNRYIFSDYLYYYTKSSAYDQWKNSIFIQATIQNIGADKYQQLPITLPHNTEQRSIAIFLDRETSRIDSLIEKKERLIGLLREKRQALITSAVTKGLPSTGSGQANNKVKMKDSGVEWIGEIPEHWEVKKIKNTAFLKSGSSITSESINEYDDYPVYGGNGLRGYTSSFNYDGSYVLIGRQGALCGNINYANGKFWASEHAVVVNPLTEIDTYWFGETLYAMNLNKYSISAAQPGLSVDQIKNLKIPFPPISDKKRISKFLKQNSKRTDNLITKIFSQISKLRELRQTLISNAVTGKIDVRDSTGSAIEEAKA